MTRPVEGAHCCYCKRPMTRRLKYEYGMRPTDMSRDHFIPKGRGGKNVANNRVWACSACNAAKAFMASYQTATLRSRP